MRKVKRLTHVLIAFAIVVASVTSNSKVSAATAEEEIYDIGYEAYLYLYPDEGKPTPHNRFRHACTPEENWN